MRPGRLLVLVGLGVTPGFAAIHNTGDSSPDKGAQRRVGVMVHKGRGGHERMACQTLPLLHIQPVPFYHVP